MTRKPSQHTRRGKFGVGTASMAVATHILSTIIKEHLPHVVYSVNDFHTKNNMIVSIMPKTGLQT